MSEGEKAKLDSVDSTKAADVSSIPLQVRKVATEEPQDEGQNRSEVKEQSSGSEGEPNDATLSPEELDERGSFHSDRFQDLGDLDDLERSLEYRSQALALTAEGHPSMPHRLASLGASYGDRYRRLGEIEDLEKSFEYRTRALALTADGHPDMPRRLADLAMSYGDQYQRLGDLEDLERSLEHRSRALALTPDGHPSMPRRLADLALSYNHRYRHLDKLEDLDKSLEYRTRALVLTPDDHPSMPFRLADLGLCYGDRYQSLGKLEDLEKSLEYRTRALALTPDGHPSMPSRLSDLAVSYGDRYQRLGALGDLEKSLEYDSRALALIPDGHPDKPDQLANLAMSYGDRYRRLGGLEDLEKSLEYLSRAVLLTPKGHPDMPRHLADLAISYTDRYRRLEDPEDLGKSLEYRARALELTPDGHSSMPIRLGDLAVSYGDRYRLLGQLEDLDKSLEYDSRALSSTPENHSELSERYFNLAISLLDHFKHTGELSYSEKSLNSFRTASQLLSGPPRNRFHHALRWVKNATEHTSLNPIEAYEATMNLLPQFIWVGANTTQRYQDLLMAENLAVNAATIAIISLQYVLALEWLEHARCVVWNQSLMLRSPIDELHSFHPDLAAKIQEIADQLHSAGSEVQATDPEQVGQERRRLAGEYDSLLAQARREPGFEDFLQPIKANRLMQTARYGPIVVINSHNDRCDALIILPGRDAIQHLPLLHFTEKKAQTTRFEMAAALRQTGLRERGIKPFQQLGSKDRIQRVLATLWNDVVKPVLDFLGCTENVLKDSLPHITWCPTGSLSFLPLHAAGDYTQPGSRVFNYVISSYTPTLTALLTSTTSSLSSGCRILAVGQENTPRRSPLPGIVEELARLKDHAKDNADYSELTDDQATTTTVLDAMEQHNWVHLACHAHQNVDDPTKSGFFLHDGTLDLASINRRSFKNKGLAFLSACQTAKGDDKLPDEAVHLASGMLMAGYPSVIATM